MRSLESILFKARSDLDIAIARKTWLDYRKANGYTSAANLLSKPDSNSKLAKGTRDIYGLTLIPHKTSGVNVCPFATDGCSEACVLMTAGRGVMSNVRTARTVRTSFAAEHPSTFLTLLLHEIKNASKTGAIIRLNVASDIRWERVLPEAFDVDGAEFYDYTKWPMASRNPPGNYRIVYSRNERDGDKPAEDYVRAGGNAAVVFDVLPKTWKGLPVINGDLHDDRIEDPAGVIVGLKAKGTAKADTSGFVVKV